MHIDSETLQKIAHLARLELNPTEEKEIQKKMEGVLNWMQQLNEVDTTNVAPLTHMTLEINALRNDQPLITISTQEALSNAPQHNQQYFQVKKVM
jgi:aspartyl-tRNA(Asn)/glutamyl-tRNA(Gln) amidotransferase subunit C